MFAPPGKPVPLNDMTGWWVWTAGACWKPPKARSGRCPGATITRSFTSRGTTRPPPRSGPVSGCRPKPSGSSPPAAGWTASGSHGRRGAQRHRRLQGQLLAGAVSVQQCEGQRLGPHGPVKSYPPNGYGLYETGGNVWEWCSDWYRADGYVGRTGVTPKPKGPDSILGPERAAGAQTREPRRLVPVSRHLLRELPPRRTPRHRGRHRHGSHRLPVREGSRVTNRCGRDRMGRPRSARARVPFSRVTAQYEMASRPGGRYLQPLAPQPAFLRSRHAPCSTVPMN